MVGHVMGLPVEESVLALAPAGVAAVTAVSIAARTTLGRIRRRRLGRLRTRYARITRRAPKASPIRNTSPNTTIPTAMA